MIQPIINSMQPISYMIRPRIDDVLRLPPGVSVRVLVFHRNAGDDTLLPNINPRGSAIKPMRFFRRLIANYRPSDRPNRMACDLWFGKDKAKGNGLELHVEYKPGHWYPLTNGSLPAHDAQHDTRLLGLKTHWRDLPPSTHVRQRRMHLVVCVS